MAKVSPFHSKLPGVTVHHNDDECPDGHDVHIQDRVVGTGDLRLCGQCATLHAWRRVTRRRNTA